MMVVNTVESFGLDGAEAEKVLDAAGLTVNKQVVPDDAQPPLRPSGIRLGTPAATTRGMGKDEMRELARCIVWCIRLRGDAQALADVRETVRALCRRFPVPGVPASA
jgi:glycine hydroxymethyltransferase